MKISLRRRHAQTVKDCAPSLNIEYVNIFIEIINLEGHLNRYIGSTVMAILVNRVILPSGAVLSGSMVPCNTVQYRESCQMAICVTI